MAIAAFIEYLSYEKNYAEHTVLAYKNDLLRFQNFIQDTFQQQALISVNYSMIRSWIIHLSDTGISNRSINRKVASLKAYYKFLVKSKQLSVSPLSTHKSLKTDKKVQVPFSLSEVQDALDLFDETNLDDVRAKLIILLLYTTGIRRAELMNIKVHDINWEEQNLRVLGKRNKERIVPLLPETLQLVKTFLKLREELNKIEAPSFLFVTNNGKKLYDAFVYRIINDYFSKVSTKTKRSPHIIRHSFATHLLNEGANLNDVKELLGHASLASTQVYTHNSMEALQRVYKNAHPRNKKT